MFLVAAFLLYLQIDPFSGADQENTSLDTKTADPDPAEAMIQEEDTMTGQDLERDQFTYEELPDEIIERITGVSWQENDDIALEDLRYIKLKHYDFDGNIQDGEMICHHLIAAYVTEIFYELYKAEYPIAQVALVEEYDGDDEASMAANNSSSFNYRTIAGTDTLSLHAYGMAVDINPLYNPYITTSSDGTLNIQPVSADIYVDRDQDFDGKIDTSDLCYQLFTSYGFTWGGSWESSKDYQHFEKDLRDLLEDSEN